MNIRIVPNGLIANGTKVYDADGNEIGGVTKIELIAEVNQPWRAVITCDAVLAGELMAELEHPKECVKKSGISQAPGQ